MSASTPEHPAAPTPAGGDSQSEPVYVKLPPPGVTHAARRPQNAPNGAIQAIATIFAFVLCCTLPVSSGLILVLLATHPSVNAHGLLWLWITMFVFVVGMALLLAYGVWREVSGWTGPGDYER
jgi:hypothetical protein